VTVSSGGAAGQGARKRLSAAHLSAALAHAARTWDELNAILFGKKMRRPVLAFSELESRLGQWDGRTRTLSLGRRLLEHEPWSAVREVLAHEMAHQFVDEVLGIHDETAHGPVFQRICAERGIDAASRGLPRGGQGAHAGGSGEDPVLRRVSRLLALAGSANVHEAEAAMKAAQRLMLQHNLDLAVSRAHQGYSFVVLGEVKGRHEAWEQILAGILSQHFFVDVIWVLSYDVAAQKEGRVLELCGTPANLEVASYVYAFLAGTAERLWRAHKQAAPAGLVPGRERGRFLLGVMTGFDEKLKAARAENREQGLVYVGDPALKDYLSRRHPRRTSGGGLRFMATDAYKAGHAEGRRLVLHRPVHGQGGSRNLVLPARR
jgi:hypothetical protein